MWATPLFLELLAALLEVLDLTVDAAAADVLEACCVAIPDPLVTAAVAAAPDEGVSEPLISAWTVELKVPVMPERVNLAENASALNWDWVASFRELDVNLIKYWLKLGPTVPSGVQVWEATLETSTPVAIDCKSVCCCALPAYRPMSEGPNAVRLGVVPSSCQVIDTGLPAGKLLVAVGLVMKTVAWAKGARAASERTRREENIVGSFGRKRRSGRRKREWMR